LDVVARQRGLQRGKLRAKVRGNALLNFSLDLLTSSAFDGGNGGIFAGSYESSAGLGLDAVNKFAKNVFEFHGPRWDCTAVAVQTSVFFDAREEVGFSEHGAGLDGCGEMEHFLRAVLANIFFEQRKKW